MSDLVDALGLVLVIEGLIYCGFPLAAKRMAAQMQDVPESKLRAGGLAAMVIGVAIVWAVRG